MSERIDWNLEKALIEWNENNRAQAIEDLTVLHQNLEAQKDILLGNKGVIVNVEE